MAHSTIAITWLGLPLRTESRASPSDVPLCRPNLAVSSVLAPLRRRVPSVAPAGPPPPRPARVAAPCDDPVRGPRKPAATQPPWAVPEDVCSDPCLGALSVTLAGRGWACGAPCAGGRLSSCQERTPPHAGEIARRRAVCAGEACPNGPRGFGGGALQRGHRGANRLRVGGGGRGVRGAAASRQSLVPPTQEPALSEAEGSVEARGRTPPARFLTSESQLSEGARLTSNGRQAMMIMSVGVAASYEGEGRAL